VLQGPQGTLYGAGSLGGVMRAVPNAPATDRPSGAAWAGVTATQHGQPSADGGALINLPLLDDRLAVRALGFAGIDGGYIDDTLRKINDINTVRTYGARGAVRWAPDNATTVDTSLLLQRIAGADSQYADAGGNGLTRASSVAQPYSNAIAQGEIAVTRHLGQQLDLTASIAYTTQHVFEQYEGDALSDPAQPGAPPAPDAYQTAYNQDDRIHMATGELRLARSRDDGTGWLIAASVLQNVDSIHRQMGGTDTSMVMGAQGGQVPLYELTGVRNIAEEETLFGEFSFHLADRLALTLGGRLVRTRLAGQSLDVSPSVALGEDPNASASRIEMRALPSAALVWHAADHLALFARYQQSFRPGGIAVRENYIERFDSDAVQSIEAGARLTTRRLESVLSLSWTAWNDIQADLIDGYGFPTTANIGDGRVLTISWTGTWRPVPALRLEAGLLANDSHIIDTTSLAASLLDTSIDRSRLPNVADWIGRGAVHYATQVFDLPLDLSGYARYTGKSTLGVGDVLGRIQGNYVDTGLELRLGDAQRSVSLGLTNLLDTRGNQFALGSPFLLRTRSEITPLRPRSVRVGVQIGF
jgi:iron complex outermembrane recepter protein